MLRPIGQTAAQESLPRKDSSRGLFRRRHMVAPSTWLMRQIQVYQLERLDIAVRSVLLPMHQMASTAAAKVVVGGVLAPLLLESRRGARVLGDSGLHRLPAGRHMFAPLTQHSMLLLMPRGCFKRGSGARKDPAQTALCSEGEGSSRPHLNPRWVTDW